MGIFDKKNVVKIEEEDLKDAKLSSIDYTEELTKKRAFIDVLGARLAIKMLFSKKIEASNVYSLYTIHSLLEDIDIADIHYEGMRIDVRLVFNRNEIFIPKSHFEYDLQPHLYLVMELNSDFSSAEFLGFFEPEAIDKNNQNNDFYFYEYDKLNDPDELKSFLKRFKVPVKLDISEANFERAQELFLSIADKDINFEDKLFLFKQLSESFELREKMVEFENFEIISNEIAKNPSIQGDGVLDIIGAQKVFDEEFETQSKEEVKAEIIGEVLTDLLDEELFEPNVEPKTEEQLQSESDFLSELGSEVNIDPEPEIKPEKESKSNGEIFENSVKALAAGIELGAVLAEGTAAAATTGAAAGAIVEGAIIEGAADILSSGVDLGNSIIENTLASSTLSEIELPEIAEGPEYLSSLLDQQKESTNIVEAAPIADSAEGFPNFDLDDFVSNESSSESSAILNNDFENNLEELSEIGSVFEDETELNIEPEILTEAEPKIEAFSDVLPDADFSIEDQKMEVVENVSSPLLPGIDELPHDELPEISIAENILEDIVPEEIIAKVDTLPLSEPMEEMVSEINIDPIQEESSADDDLMLTALPELDMVGLDEVGSQEQATNDYVHSMSDFNVAAPVEETTVEATEAMEDTVSIDVPKEEISFEALKSHTEAFADFNMDVLPFDVGVDSSALPFNVGIDAPIAPEVNNDIPDSEISAELSLDNNNDFEIVENIVQEEEELKALPETVPTYEEVKAEPIESSSNEVYSGREAKERELALREAMIHNQEQDQVGSKYHDPENPDYVELDVFSEKRPENRVTNEFEVEIAALTGEIELTPEEEAFLMQALKMCEEGYNKAESGVNPTSASADDILKEADALIEDFNLEDDKDPLKVLFNGEQNTELPEMEEELPEDNKKIIPLDLLIKNKKMVIAASVATVVIVSFAIGSAITKNKDAELANLNTLKPVQVATNPQNMNEDLANLNQNQIPGTDMNLPGQSSTLDPLTQQPIPGENQDQLGENKDMGQAVSNAFTSEPVSANVSKIAWEVPEDLAYNDGFRKYLQVAGKNLKLNLQTNLLLATEMAYSNKILVDLVINRDGSLQSSNIVASSGSKQVDKIVLQSVKETLKYLKMPASELGGSYADATLIINF